MAEPSPPIPFMNWEFEMEAWPLKNILMKNPAIVKECQVPLAPYDASRKPMLGEGELTNFRRCSRK